MIEKSSIRRSNTTKNKGREGISIDFNFPRSVNNSRYPGANFTTSKRPEMLSTCSPGPKYLTALPLTHNRKIVVTLKQRYKQFLSMFGKGVHDVPGPGKYELMNEILNTEKGRTIFKTGRENPESKVRTATTKDSGNSATVHNLEQTRSRSAQPGPGSYNILRELGNPKKGVGFAKSTRYTKGSMFGPEEIDELDRIVGPGYYQIKSTIPQLQGWVRTGTKFEVNKIS